MRCAPRRNNRDPTALSVWSYGRREMRADRDDSGVQLWRHPHAGRVVACLLAALGALLLRAGPAAAVPSFSRQTGQPCSLCHIGSFGPQLTEYGREFKVTGYTLTGGEGL